MAIQKQQRPPFPKGQFLQIFIFVAALFVLFDNSLRTLLGRAVGFVFNPIIGFDHQQPVLTILLASIIMVGMSTGVRHLFVDWVRMAYVQNVMRSFQRAMREARVARDPKKIEQLQRAQPKLMGLQAELSSSQMKPLGFTFLIIIPMFAWLTDFIVHIEYPFFSAPWNERVDMFDSTVLPHWLLFYSGVSIPFGALVQKVLKFFTWRHHWHLMRTPPAEPTPMKND